MQKKRKKLNSKNNQQNKQDIYLMYGYHPVIAALNNQKRQIIEIFCTYDFFLSNKNKINSVTHHIYDAQQLSNLIGKENNHQGVVAKIHSIYRYDIKDFLQKNIEDNLTNIAILDQVTDPQNIGAIIRNAAAFNIKAIIMPKDHSPAENATIAKAASGALELVPIFLITNISQIIKLLKEYNFWVIGLTSDKEASCKFEEIPSFEKLALILGNEGSGLRHLTAKNCDMLVNIPMSSQIESLNVSCSSAIAFSSIYLQKTKK